jgi:hypothetical protein
LKDLTPQATPVSREQIMRLESVLFQAPDEAKLDIDRLTSHHFAEGIYLRQLFIPAGVVVTGKIHRTQHLTIICSGTVKITTDHGVQQITGPAVFVSEPGIKKACFAITDAVLMNPHPTESTDLDEIEQKFIAPSFEALAMEKDDAGKHQLGTDRRSGRPSVCSISESAASSEAAGTSGPGEFAAPAGVSAPSRLAGQAEPR